MAAGTRDLKAAAGVAVAALIVYAPALRIGFLSDDFLILSLIRSHDALHHPTVFFGISFYDYYRPLVFLSHTLDLRVWGLSASAFHATNIALHALNAAAVFLLARRFASRPIAVVAALVFAVHPTTEESVFWIAGRFDLLSAAALLFALWLYGRAARWSYALALGLFAASLLSKESGVALLVMAAADDVLIARRSWWQTAVRLAPFGGVGVVYMAVRTAVGLHAAGGLYRAGKIAMLGAAVLALLWIAIRERSRQADRRTDQSRPRLPIVAIWLGALAFAVALFVIGSRTPLGASIGFAGYAAYFLAPSAWLPSHWAIPRGTALYLVIGSGTVAVAAVVSWRIIARLRDWPALAFGLVMLAAALVPVSAMPSRNHLYLATAATSVLLAAGLQLLRRRWVPAIVGLLIVAGGVEIAVASRDWRRASDLTRQTVAVIRPDLDPCGSRDVVLLIVPASVNDVPSNITEDAFRILTGCAPGRLRTLLRVVGGDVTASASRSGSHIQVRIPDYHGNLVGTTDLSRFVVQIPSGGRIEIETPLGRLTSTPNGTMQEFDLTLNEEAGRAPVFYYSNGAMARLLG